MTKILIEVSGGNIQRIISTSSEVKIIVIDYDNLDDLKGSEEFEEEVIQETKPFTVQNLYEAFTDSSDMTEMEIRDILKSNKL